MELKLSDSSGYYVSLKTKIEAFTIDCSHFNPSNRGNKLPTRKIRTFKEVFIKKDKPDCTVRQIVISNNLIPYRCSYCNSEPIWLGKPMALHLDHINGTRNDNRLENLRFLCPNCHQTTDTWGSKRLKQFSSCKLCSSPITKRKTYCTNCYKSPVYNKKER